MIINRDFPDIELIKSGKLKMCKKMEPASSGLAPHHPKYKTDQRTHFDILSVPYLFQGSFIRAIFMP